MAATRAAEPFSIAPPARENNPDLQIYVIFTNPEETKWALQAAHDLARDLEARLVLLVAQVVPYPLPLEHPPVAPEFSERVLSELAGGHGADLTVRLYLCRDREQTIRSALQRNSLVVIGTKAKRRWSGSERTLGRMLKRHGHQVLFVDTHRIRATSIGFADVPSKS